MSRQREQREDTRESSDSAVAVHSVGEGQCSCITALLAIQSFAFPCICYAQSMDPEQFMDCPAQTMDLHFA